jgi:hypothetical protein
MGEPDKLLTDVVQFCAEAYASSSQDRFTIALTTVPVEPELRGSVYERCVQLIWQSKELRSDYATSRACYFGCPRYHWGELLDKLSHLNINVVQFLDFWQISFSLPPPGREPQWLDSVRGRMSLTPPTPLPLPTR